MAAPSRNDIRRQLVLDESDSVAQVQLAFFEPLDLQAVTARSVLQGFDRGVEIPVLLHQASQGRPQLPFFFVGHQGRLEKGSDKLPPPARQLASQVSR